jgi:hypothetical protein
MQSKLAQRYMLDSVLFFGADAQEDHEESRARMQFHTLTTAQMINDIGYYQTLVSRNQMNSKKMQMMLIMETTGWKQKLVVGDKLDVKHASGEWYEAEVSQVRPNRKDGDDDEIKVSYLTLSKLPDEWIYRDDKRLAELGIGKVMRENRGLSRTQSGNAEPEPAPAAPAPAPAAAEP